MHEFSISYLRCVRCGKKLELEILSEKNEIEEGFLFCSRCILTFPILSTIPIMWDDFSQYASNRSSLVGQLYNQTNNLKMKSFLKNFFLYRKNNEDRTNLEERWVKIYQASKQSKFYYVLKNHLKAIPKTSMALDVGCSIGIMTKYLSDYNDLVFGIDRSFAAIKIAKKSLQKNLDYIIADSLHLPFENKQFDLVMALNLLDLVDPIDLLASISKMIREGYLVISDPYDYERGKNSVKHPLDASALRKEIKKLGFQLTFDTSNQSFIPWNLHLSNRISLQYKTDLVIGKRI